MSIHPRYIIQDPFAEEVLTSSARILRSNDNSQFLASIIPEINAKDVNKDTYSTDLATSVLPSASVTVSRLLNHPNIVSLIDIVHTSSLPGSISEAGKHGNITIWEDMDAGLLSYLLPASSDLPDLSDVTKWKIIAAENFNRFSLPEGLCWHVLRSISRALLWLHYGVKETAGIPGEWEQHDHDWHPILIMDISPGQIWFQHPHGKEHYGPCKLGGFQYAKVTGFPGGKIASEPRVDDMPDAKKFYWAPEVYGKPGIHSRASEIWSLGATLYVMMTGIPPSRHHDYIWTISRMNDKGFSAELREVVGAMLEPNPQDRPDAFKIIDKADDAYRRWRATSRECMEYVDVDDEKIAARMGIGRN